MNNLITSDKFYKIILRTKNNIDFQKFSPTTYLKFKKCPKQWLLENILFDELNNKKYPSLVFPQSLIGSAIHKTIEDLIFIMKDYQCNKVNDINWSKVKSSIISLKELFLKNAKKEILKYLNNPRNKRSKEDYEIYIDDNIQNIVFKIKTMASKLKLDNTKVNSKKQSTKLNFELTNANLSEFKISSDKLNFFGYIDFLKINNEIIEIYDFKTGLEKENDEKQILLYSLIWKFDEVHNPSSRNVSKLTLTYGDKDKEIQPFENTQLNKKADELITEISNLKNIINNKSFEAYPSIDNCKFCNVKQLCNQHWNFIDENKLDLSNINDNFVNSNIEVCNLSKVDDRWTGTVSHSNIFQQNQNIIIDNRGEFSLNRDILNDSKEARILNFNYYFDFENQIQEKKIILNKFSEVFKII